MNYLPKKDVKIPGTEAMVRLCSLSAADSQRVAKDELDSFEALVRYTWNPSTDSPVWESVEAMQAALSMGQVAWLFDQITKLSKEGAPSFRRGEGEEDSAESAPDGEGVRVQAE